MLFAQAVSGVGLGQLLIYVVVIAACIGLVYVALQQFGVAIPAFAVKIFWIVVCAFLVIVAIRFVLAL